jgi:hypothetical protein
METIPITLRVPDVQLQIIDEYIKENNLSRSLLFRDLINDMARKIINDKQKQKLITASKKVSNKNLKENNDLNITLSDGLNDE